MNDLTNEAAPPGQSASRRRPSLPPLSDAPRPQAVPRHPRAVVLALLIPFILPACTSAKTVPRPGKWAQPVASTVLKNWYMISPDLYRSEQPDRKGFEEIRAQGIRTVLNLRGDHHDDTLVQGLGFTLITVPMAADSFSEEDVIKALKAIQDAPKPVLVHCQHGADRTGLVIAMYRIVFQGWSKEDAIAELKGGGYGFHWYYFNIPSFIKDADVAKIRARLEIR